MILNDFEISQNIRKKLFCSGSKTSKNDPFLNRF